MIQASNTWNLKNRFLNVAKILNGRTDIFIGQRDAEITASRRNISPIFLSVFVLL